MQIRHPDRMA
ncbi:hypothetical protein LINGRAHAP2_LOCUS10454 [Linum grandiflorum]